MHICGIMYIVVKEIIHKVKMKGRDTMEAKKPTTNLTIAKTNDESGAKKLVRCADCHFRKPLIADDKEGHVFMCSMFRFTVGADFFCACGYKDNPYEREQRVKVKEYDR